MISYKCHFGNNFALLFISFNIIMFMFGGSEMKAKVNKDLCIGCGSCVSICPDVFNFNDEGYAQAIEDEIKDENIEKVEEAIECCPTEAISKEEKKI
jgi:ferredoxin